MELEDFRRAPVRGGRVAEAVLRTLNAHYPLSPSDEAVVEGLAGLRLTLRAGQPLVGPDQVRFLLSGWAAAQRILPDGRRQIFRIATPGEIVGLPGRIDGLDWEVVSLTDVRVTDAAPALDAAYDGRAQSLGAAFDLALRAQRRELLDAIVRLGRQTSYERVAHLLVDLQRRLEIAGLTTADRFPMPLTQETLADTLGLSVVHVNRTLQHLRRDGLIDLRSGYASIKRLDDLARVTNFGGASGGDAPGAARPHPWSARTSQQNAGQGAA